MDFINELPCYNIKYWEPGEISQFPNSKLVLGQRKAKTICICNLLAIGAQLEA